MKYVLPAALLGVLALSSASALRAGNIESLAPSCASERLQTLQDYLDMDGECSVGILNFSGFSFSSSGTAGDALYTPSEIALTPLFSESSMTGFAFSHIGDSPFEVGAGLTANYVIDYSYVIDAGPVGGAADLGMDPPFGNITITQDICADSHLTFSATGAPQCTVFSDFSVSTVPQTLSVDNTNPPGSWTAHLNLSPEVLSFATVRNTIHLDGAQGGAGFDSLMSTGTIVNSAPEPLSSGLCLSGLLAVAIFRKRLAG